MKCMNCNGTHDVVNFYVNEEQMILCAECRHKAFAKVGKIQKTGRPSLGVTKKVSLTLSEEDWKWIDDNAEGNRSQLLRYLINEAKDTYNKSKSPYQDK